MTKARGSIGAALALTLVAASACMAKGKEFTDSFMFENCNFVAQGTNPYLILTPGYQLVLETKVSKKPADEHVVLRITVLQDTEVVDGVTTRVVEEHETENGVLKEVSRNFFAICEQNNTVVYFGEDVDNYDDTGTMVINNDGAWRAGVNGARPGVIMPGLPLLGARYMQEIAPDVALDRAEILSVTDTFVTPAGTFTNVLRTKESSALERGKSLKLYAPGVGLIVDDDLVLTGSSN